jgi:hypothetical protein
MPAAGELKAGIAQGRRHARWPARHRRDTLRLMRRALRLHPDSRCAAVTHIDVEIAQTRPDLLLLSYIVSGTIGDVRMPPPMTAARADDLWRHTCFEAFVGAAASACYYEFNFAPSRRWAAYRFSGYRSGMCVADEIAAPSIEVGPTPGGWTLQAKLDLHRLSGLPSRTSRRLALSAVIEDMDGEISYWALAHPPGKPDFHHPVSFAHELSAAPQS